MKVGDKVLCIKTVIMSNGTTESFTEGKEYEVTGVDSGWSALLNNQGYREHSMRSKFFKEHFKEKEEFMFKPGARVVPMPGMKNDMYTITSYRPDTVSEIISIRDNGKFELKPVKNYPSHYGGGCTFDVESKYFKLWGGDNMVKCEATDCENNDKGLCPVLAEKFQARGISSEDIAKLSIKSCVHYVKRNNDKELWQETLDSKYSPVFAQLFEIINMLEKKCPLCHKHFYSRCVDCSWKNIFGRCIKDEGGYSGKYGELIDALVAASKIAGEICSGIREQINK